MRDPAGELADRLHLLRLRKLRFQIFLLGDVDKIEHQAALGIRVAAGNCLGWRACVCGSRRRRKTIADPTVEPTQQQDDNPFGRASEADLDGLTIDLPVRVQGEPCGKCPTLTLIQETDHLAADQFLRRGAKEFAHGPVRLDKPAESIDYGDADRRVGEHPLKGFPRQGRRGIQFAAPRRLDLAAAGDRRDLTGRGDGVDIPKAGSGSSREGGYREAEATGSLVASAGYGNGRFCSLTRSRAVTKSAKRICSNRIRGHDSADSLDRMTVGAGEQALEGSIGIDRAPVRSDDGLCAEYGIERAAESVGLFGRRGADPQ